MLKKLRLTLLMSSVMFFPKGIYAADQEQDQKLSLRVQSLGKAKGHGSIIGKAVRMPRSKSKAPSLASLPAIPAGSPQPARSCAGKQRGHTPPPLATEKKANPNPNPSPHSRASPWRSPARLDRAQWVRCSTPQGWPTHDAPADWPWMGLPAALICSATTAVQAFALSGRFALWPPASPSRPGLIRYPPTCLFSPQGGACGRLPRRVRRPKPAGPQAAGFRVRAARGPCGRVARAGQGRRNLRLSLCPLGHGV